MAIPLIHLFKTHLFWREYKEIQIFQDQMEKIAQLIGDN